MAANKLPVQATGANIREAISNHADLIDSTKATADGAVQAEAGKRLITTAEAAKLANTSGTNTGDQDLTGLVQKVDGKGLSTNDYTTDEKNKLAGVAGTNTGDQDLSGLTPLNTFNSYKTTNDAAVAAATPLFQAETTAFAGKIKAAGGILEANELNLVDSFFVKGKNDGWLPLIKWMWVPMGNNLASALVNLIAVSGVPTSLTNNNFVESDYNKTTGFGTDQTANTSKWLGTGFIPSAYGITPSNLTVGVVPLAAAPTNKNFLSTTPPSGTNYLAITNSPATTITLAGTSGAGSSGVQAYGAATLIGSWGPSNTYRSSVNGVAEHNSTLTVPPSVTLDTELVIFKNPTTIYSEGKLSEILVGVNIPSAAQIKSLEDARAALQVGLGRLQRGGVIGEWFGDSITLGAGASTSYNRWATTVARNIGAREINFGSGGSQLRITPSSGIIGGFLRYTDMVNIPCNLIFCMYGTNDYGLTDTTATGDTTLIADYKSKLNTMVDSWQKRNIRVILVGPPWGNNGVPVARRNAWQLAMRQVATMRSVPFVDNETVFTDASATPGTAYFPVDGLHPNDAGHKLIADNVTSIYNGVTYRNLTIDFGVVPANSYLDSAAIALYNANVNNIVDLGLPVSVPDGITFRARVTALDTIVIRAINSTSADIDPPSMVIKASCRFTI